MESLQTWNESLVQRCMLSQLNLPSSYSLGVLLSVGSFHLPNLDLNANIDVDSSKSNTGLIHSYLQNNWSQSLNIGSVSIAATIIILFLALVMHLKTTERMNQLSKNKSLSSMERRKTEPLSQSL